MEGLIGELARVIQDLAGGTLEPGAQAASRLEVIALAQRGGQLQLVDRSGAAVVEAKTETSVADAIGDVFEHWKTATGKPKARLTPERASRIRARLGQGFSVADLRACVDGAMLSEHHVAGGHLDIVTIMKNGAVVEQHVERARGAAPVEDDAPSEVRKLREAMGRAREKGDADEWNRLNRQLRDALR